jgi:pimeloyl-ACP methyl ester carboxylesterase
MLNYCLKGDGVSFPGFENMAEITPEFIAMWSSMNNYDDSFYAKTVENASSVPLYAWLNAFHGVEIYPEEFASITVPVQIIWGTEDVFFFHGDQIALINGLGSDYITFEIKRNKSHNLLMEDHGGEEISADVLYFLKVLKGQKSPL